MWHTSCTIPKLWCPDKSIYVLQIIPAINWAVFSRKVELWHHNVQATHNTPLPNRIGKTWVFGYFWWLCIRPHKIALGIVNGTWIWGYYKRLQRKRITHLKDMGETVTLQQDITKALWTTVQSWPKHGIPSISLQSLICFPSSFLLFDLFLSLVPFPINSNFPTAVFQLI